MVRTKILKPILLIVLALVTIPATVYAAPLAAGTQYQTDEVFFGSGGSLNSCSTTYCTKQALGETAVGNSSSTNYQVQAGFNTDRTPYLWFTVSNLSTSLKVLSTNSTTTAYATFSVKSYLSSGYQVVTTSNPPQYNSYTLSNIHTNGGSCTNSSAPSQTGTEQFGMNLEANTTPTSPNSSNPVQVPSSSYSYGQAATGYNVANCYRYIPGDEIAYSNSSSGETDYTISYIFNISQLTPGGYYSFNDVLVATATF